MTQAMVTDIAEHQWKKLLIFTPEGKLTKDIGNAILYLRNHSEWRRCLAYDEFSDRIFWARKPPGLDDESIVGPDKGALVSDLDVPFVHHWFARSTGMKFAQDVLRTAIEFTAHQNKICPPRDYLKECRRKWDGKPRLATMLRDYFGVPQRRYTEKVATWWMISAVARIFEPGVKADCILILQGKQGSKKSSALQVLGGDWYSNNLPDVSSPDASRSLAGAWIVEIGELEAMNRSSETAFKDFSARTFDRYRKPYGKFFVTQPRTCVFAATTNEHKIFRDATGARRFWPVRLPDDALIDIEALQRDRDQLWGEAAELFYRGEQHWPDDETAAEILAEQDDRYVEDVWTQAVALWCDNQERRGCVDFTTAEVMMSALAIEQPKLDLIASQRVAKILRRLGYESSGRRLVGSRRVAVYLCKSAPPTENEDPT